MRVTLEVIATSVEDAVAAAAGGADRLELTADLDAGGTTPDPWLIRAVKAAVETPVYVMIRPRAGDFVYAPEEVEVMVRQARQARQMGADGIVVGALRADGRIDLGAVARVAEAAELPVTFHRAFDESSDLYAAFDRLGELPHVERLLTSGGRGSAPDNRRILAELVARGRRMPRPVRVMPGAGITAGNVQTVLRDTGASEVHLGRAVRQPSTPMGRVNERLVREIRKLLETV